MPRFRSCVFLLCLSLGLAIPGFAQKADPPPPAFAEKPPDYSQEAVVVEQFYNGYTFETDGTGKREQRLRVRVQSDAGVQQYGQVIISYNSANEKVEFPYVRVRKPDGSQVTAGPDAVQDLSAPVEREAPVYTDLRQKHVTVPGLRPGDVLEYDILITTHTALAPGQFWMSHDFEQNAIVLQEQLEVSVPAGRAVKLKTAPGSEPKIADESGRRVYRWGTSHRERDDDDSDSKKKKKQPSEPKPPAVQLSTFASWEEVGRWYAGLERDRRAPTSEIRGKAAELTAGRATDLEKVEALYDFVAKNFRYISLSFGVGRYQPHAAGDVLHNQYGDCKDKHTLLSGLLEATGLHASSVLIHSTRKLDPDVPSPSQFDHMITMVPVGKEEVWMDTTTEVAPFRLLAFPLRKKQALVVPQEGVPRLEETPADAPMAGVQDQQVEGKVNEVGKLSIHVRYSARGDLELPLRMIFRRVPNAQWKRLLENMNRMVGLDGEVSDWKVGDPSDTKQPFLVEYDISKANYFDWSKKKTELDLPLSLMRLPDVDADSAPDGEPLKLGPKGSFRYSIRLELPPNLTARAPVPISMTRDYGAYQASYKVEGNVFSAERKLELRQPELPVSRASDYQAFQRAVAADSRQELSLENKSAGSLTPPPNMKADDLNESGQDAYKNGNYALALELLKRAVELDPNHKRAWLNLGNTYVALRRLPEAVEALRQQIAINAYDEFAYNSLGLAYWQQRKYEDAVTAFQKQIEVNPLDPFAHGNLGSMYAEWHKYKEAVPELEKAASINNRNALLQTSLGDAYLNLGEDDKALAAFDRAVELAPAPPVWNNVAYRLSEKKTHLDRAEQYAESALSTTVAAARNLTLDEVTDRELGLTASLAAYWDTLGWVYFAKGDLPRAEKYVRASWLLDQHGEVGDHLAQIYEKLDRKEDAIRLYAMAMEAYRPVPETRGRLAALVGGDDKVSKATVKYRDALVQLRTIKLGNLVPDTATAEFWLLFGPGSGGAKLETAKFISGDEKLRGAVRWLQDAKYEVVLPDEAPAKMLRRGILSCTPSAGCVLVLMLPEDVQAGN
jgi:tetratricopeptide (TPR) repeat protein